MFPFAFIFFSLITHIYFSLLENDLRRTVRYLIGCYQYYRSKSILFLKLYGSSNVFHGKRHPVKMGEPVVIHSDIHLPRIFYKTDMISEQFKNS
jgi:hypothetical protein